MLKRNQSCSPLLRREYRLGGFTEPSASWDFRFWGLKLTAVGPSPQARFGTRPSWGQKPTPFLRFMSVVASPLHVLTPLGLGGQAQIRMRLLLELFVLWVLPLCTRTVGPYGVSNSRSGFWSISDLQK